MIRASRALQRFNWERCVPRFFPERAKPFKEMEAKLDVLNREVHSAPEKIEPINWDYWKKNIRQTQLVDQLQKEYESKAWAPVVPDVYMTEAQHKANMAAAEKKSEYYKFLIQDLEAKLKTVEEKKSKFAFMTTRQLMDQIPGFHAEWDRLLEELHPYVPDETVKALETFNPAEVSKQIRAGQVPVFPVEAFEALPPESPIRVAMNDASIKDKDAASKFGVALPTLEEAAATIKASQTAALAASK